MKPVILVLVCVVLVGCTPKPKQGPPINVAGPCMPAKAACIVSVDGASLIRAPKFWLLDLRGHSEFKVAAVIDAAKQCDGAQGCGTAMTEPQIKALVGELAQAKIEKLPITGGSAVAYRVQQGTVVQFWLDAKAEEILPQLSPVPLQGVECIPGQCELPPGPPPPFRMELPMEHFVR